MDIMDMKTPTSSPTAAPAQTTNSKMAWVLLVVGLVVGALIVAGLWWYWPKPTTTQAPSTTSTSSSSSAPATVAATPACGLNNLSMSVGGTDGTAGTIYQHMVFTNKGTSTCTLAGFPVVVLLDASGNPLDQPATPSIAAAPTTITLAPNAKAYVAVGFPEAANFSSGQCSANSKTIRVYIPGTAAYLESAYAKPNCPGFSSTALAAGS